MVSVALQCVKALLCLAVCSLSLSVGVLAQSSADAPMALSSSDQKFVRSALADGMLEVELGRLASQRGGSEVKRFAERMVQEQGQLNAELQRIAVARGEPTVSKLGRDREATLERIARLSGADFDIAYSKQVLANQQEAVARFDQWSITANDPELKAVAAQALPGLREHLQAARALAPNTTLGH